ncbi:MAG: hypothetical protein GXO47_14115 [Chlorobi bacterium]|nr:hypothetical protein [Chlorobiota bacterium]
MRSLAVILFLLLSVSIWSQDNNTPVAFTLGDRDRLMRNEQKIDALRREIDVKFEAVNERIDSVNTRIDDLKDQIGFLTTLVIFVLGGMMSLIGFVIYDRRTAIKPVVRGQDRLEDILVEYSKEDKKLRDILKNAGIL